MAHLDLDHVLPRAPAVGGPDRIWPADYDPVGGSASIPSYAGRYDGTHGSDPTEIRTLPPSGISR